MTESQEEVLVALANALDEVRQASFMSGSAIVTAIEVNPSYIILHYAPMYDLEQDYTTTQHWYGP